MIFDSKKDGKRAEDFHEKCDGRGPTVSFIQIKDGPCIGGFTTAHWRKIEEEDKAS